MAEHSIILRFPTDIPLTPERASIAADIAVDFYRRYQGRAPGVPGMVGYRRAGYSWSVWWTKAGAVSVRCQWEVTNG